MGWNSAGEIFDPVCTAIVTAVEDKAMRPDVAEKVLATLIAKLQDGDWDVEDESLEQFTDHPFVVAAFKAQGVEVQDWMLPSETPETGSELKRPNYPHGSAAEFAVAPAAETPEATDGN